MGQARRLKASPRRARALPRVGDRLRLGPLELSRLVVGEVDEPGTVSEAFEAGLNTFVVSADLHWPAHEALRRGLTQLLSRRGVRDRLVVVGLSFACQPDHSRSAFRALLDAVPALRRLDVLGMGGVGMTDAIQRVAALADMRRDHLFGCQAVAAAFHLETPAALLLEHGLIDLGLLRFNAVDDSARSVFPALGAPGRAAVLACDALGGFEPPERLDALGVDPLNWRPSRLDHYRFVLSQGAFDGLALSALGRGELARLDAALAQGPLDAESQAYLVRTARIGRGRPPLRSS